MSGNKVARLLSVKESVSLPLINCQKDANLRSFLTLNRAPFLRCLSDESSKLLRENAFDMWAFLCRYDQNQLKNLSWWNDLLLTTFLIRWFVLATNFFEMICFLLVSSSPPISLSSLSRSLSLSLSLSLSQPWLNISITVCRQRCLPSMFCWSEEGHYTKRRHTNIWLYLHLL